MTRDSMVFYRSFADGIEELDEKDQLEAFWNIIRYGIDGIEPENGGPARGVFRMARPQIDSNNRRYENGKRGGRPNKPQGEADKKPNHNQSKTKQKPNDNQTETNTKPNVYVYDNENVLKENTLKGVKEKRFAPPSKTEVEEYCREKGYHIDADRFVDFYESKGWYVGKNKMKDWKAAVRNWSRSQRPESTAEAAKRQGKSTEKNRFFNFDQRSYDDKLDDMILQKRLEEIRSKQRG